MSGAFFVSGSDITSNCRNFGSFQFMPEVSAGVGMLHHHYRLRSSRSYDFTAAASAFRPKVDDVIRRLDHIHVVFDHDHRIALVRESPQHLQEHLGILEVETRGGLVKDVHCTACTDLRQLRGELDALGFAA